MSVRMPLPARFACLGLSLLAMASACDAPVVSVPWPPPVVHELSGRYPAELVAELAIPSGRTGWLWSAAGISPPRAAELIIEGRAWLWRLEGVSGETAPPVRIRLVPDDPDAWHEMEIHTDTSRPGEGFPLPRRAVRSPHYADLLHLVQELTRPRFDRHVTHWYRRPVPVAAGAAVSGTLDLRACLRKAVAVWNADADAPLFVWAPESACGVRLLHLPGGPLHPAMSADLIQRDDEGRALRLQIRVGDTYDDPRDERYAVRGFVHELGHALLLWGHSDDREHVLCRIGPFTDEPSDDERRAVRLLQALPAGMSLAGYGRSTEIEPPGQQGEGTSVAEFGLSQEACGSQTGELGRQGRFGRDVPQAP